MIIHGACYLNVTKYVKMSKSTLTSFFTSSKTSKQPRNPNEVNRAAPAESTSDHEAPSPHAFPCVSSPNLTVINEAPSPHATRHVSSPSLIVTNEAEASSPAFSASHSLVSSNLYRGYALCITKIIDKARKGVLETYKEKVGTNQKTRTFVRCLVCQEFHDEIRYLSRTNRIYIADGIRC